MFKLILDLSHDMSHMIRTWCVACDLHIIMPWPHEFACWIRLSLGCSEIVQNLELCLSVASAMALMFLNYVFTIFFYIIIVVFDVVIIVAVLSFVNGFILLTLWAL